MDAHSVLWEHERIAFMCLLSKTQYNKPHPPTPLGYHTNIRILQTESDT